MEMSLKTAVYEIAIRSFLHEIYFMEDRYVRLQPMALRMGSAIVCKCITAEGMGVRPTEKSCSQELR